jgi:hypothetical protein
VGEPIYGLFDVNGTEKWLPAKIVSFENYCDVTVGEY